MFQRVLIANRGEIALRIIRACKELGVQTVAVYSQADRGARYLSLADQAICIGRAPPADSYLNIPAIISAAEIADVQAIHPGYGFLAENAHFAEICRSCKIEFIGPSVEAMRQLGDKSEARKLAKKCKVPTVPGSVGLIETEADALSVAEEIGYPVMIKAAAGGGGRGMRLAHNKMSLRAAVNAARSEAELAFKDSSVYLEKFIESPRHVEVQILGDLKGRILHFYERDCTLQRRHQKLFEETPSPSIRDSTRQEMCKAAVKLARSAGYSSVGTIEFLVDRKENFFFIEANARIQVEHPITEMVTGHDLVKWQIRIASGESLELRQRDIVQRGVALECRINAEDPARNFQPCPGRVDQFHPPGGAGIRVDSAIYPGATVSPSYDSLVAKLISYQPTRTEAIATMKRALEEFKIGPIATTIPLHTELLSHAQFLEGNIDTGFIERTW